MKLKNYGLSIYQYNNSQSVLAGGLYAYVCEVWRLQHLVSSGKRVTAKILKKEKIDSGSESVAHYLVIYEYIDTHGKSVVEEQDSNSGEFFNTLSEGDAIEVVYQEGTRSNSSPFSQVHADLKISK